MNTPTALNASILPKVSIRELIETQLLDYAGPQGQIMTTEPSFITWMGQTWFGADRITETRAVVRDQATAKAMLATWIESRINAQGGVWFGDSVTHFQLGLIGRQPITVEAPKWMVAYLSAIPKAKRQLTEAERKIIDHGERLVRDADFEYRRLRTASYSQGRAA